MALLRRKRKDEEERGFMADVEPRPERNRLTPVDVQQKVFRLSFRGYNEHDVDAFLDEITEEMAALHEENKRLREEMESRGGPEPSEDAKRRAEETVRRAREHAAKLIEDAERQAGGGGGGLSTAYLVREREFLQQLAALVQERATALKDEAKKARSGNA